MSRSQLSGRNEVTAYLGLGGNLGDPERAMAEALTRLDADPATRIVAVSSLYRTPPWGVTDQPDFLNAVAKLRTTAAPRALLDLALGIEKAMKRERRGRWGPRLIDIDILAYGALRLDEPGLTVPHPRLAERAFVLVPLAEIAPELEIDARPVAEMLAKISTAGIERVAPAGWWRRGA